MLFLNPAARENINKCRVRPHADNTPFIWGIKKNKATLIRRRDRSEGEREGRAVLRFWCTAHGAAQPGPAPTVDARLRAAFWISE